MRSNSLLRQGFLPVFFAAFLLIFNHPQMLLTHFDGTEAVLVLLLLPVQIMVPTSPLTSPVAKPDQTPDIISQSLPSLPL
jgi:hypothetical protein